MQNKTLLFILLLFIGACTDSKEQKNIGTETCCDTILNYNIYQSFHVPTYEQAKSISRLKPKHADKEPAFKIRGTKGWAWTPEQMLAEIPYLRKFNMNFLMNCYFSMFNFPEGDNKWWEPLPDSLVEDYKQIIQECIQNDIEFCFALNPNLNSSRCLDYYNPKDFDALWQHYELFADMGVNWFCVCLDDITNGIDAKGQALVANKLYNKLKTKNAQAKFIFCPTIYASAWIAHKAENKNYLLELGEHLDPNIYCFWTGDDVRGPIRLETAKEYKELLANHPLIIWDNYPVNNGVKLLNLGPVVGRDSLLYTLCDGYMSNPMREQNEINRIPLYTCAQYAYDPVSYNPVHSIAEAIYELTASEKEYEVIADLVNVYYGQLLGPDRHCNTARLRYDEYCKSPQAYLSVNLYVKYLQKILENMKTLFPNQYMEEKKVLEEDINWMCKNSYK